MRLADIKERFEFALFCILHKRSLAAQQKWQLKHLQRMIQHAHQHVPLWRSLLDQAGVDPESIRSLEDMSKVPVTSKETYLGKMAEEYTDSSHPAPSYWYVTSGTSGTPFTFLMGERARQVRYADFASLRFLWWRGEPLARISMINFARVRIRARSNEHRFFISVEEYLKNPREALKRIAEFKPEIIGSYPSLLLDMAEQIEKDPSLRFEKLKYALSFGETLSQSVREATEKSLVCEVYDRYGLEEIGAVGVECAEHKGFHINTESVFVEITDDAYAPVSPGVEGKIVVTDLFNYGMPFIRYDSGDHGSISYEPCACGLRSPRVWVKGRYSAYLSFPTRRIHHLEFDAAMDKLMNYVFKYQIAKRSDNEIWARIIPGPAFHSGVPNLIEQNIRKLVGPEMRILVKEVTELPITSKGKSLIVIDESV